MASIVSAPLRVAPPQPPPPAVAKPATTLPNNDDALRPEKYVLERHTEPALWRSWTALAHDASPFLRPEFFALEEPLIDGERVLFAASRSGKLAGALPLIRRGRRLESLASDHAPTFDYVGDADAVDGVWRAIHDDSGWDTIVLTQLPATSILLTRLPTRALADLCVTVVKESDRSPFFYLPNHEARLSSKLKQNIRRCAKKLGDVELERVTTFSRAALDEGLMLEGAAWKDSAGTSIASRAALRHFYLALARLSARRGELSLYFLRAHGRRVAFLFALDDGVTLFALKTGYDPACADFSPGQLLFAEVARDAERRGLIELDFMGQNDEWKRRWTTRTHDHVTLVIYRPTVRGASMFVGREIIKPNLPSSSTARIAAIKNEVARHQRHCQHHDLIAAHSLLQHARFRKTMGLGIRSGLERIFAAPSPASSSSATTASASASASATSPTTPKPRLGALSRFGEGEWVRVKSAEEVRATLDKDNKLRGLAFVPAQWSSCGGVYRVMKRMRRLLDDEGEMRPVAHTVLLEGVTCDGRGEDHMGCGRHCPLMFRDDWLTPAEAPTGDATTTSSTTTTTSTTIQWARVRHAAEIKKTLDAKGQHDGVTFMPEMERFAGKRLPIVRRLEKVFELNRWTTPRAPVYLLDGAFCMGATLGHDGPCDRACTLMWHGDWLEIEPEP